MICGQLTAKESPTDLCQIINFPDPCGRAYAVEKKIQKITSASTNLGLDAFLKRT